MEDNHQIIEIKHERILDNQNTMEDEQKTFEDNLQTLEDNHQTMEDNKEPNNSVYTCEECGKIFSEKEKLGSHKNYTHRIEVSVCQICGNEFQNKQKLHQHVIARHNDQEKHCDMCVKVFKNNSDLYGHKKKVHEVTENLSCSGCGTKMMNVFKLKRHMKKCRGSKPTQDNLNCIECNQTFESIKSFNGHNKFVHSDDPVKCPICQRDSKNISSFRQHLNRAHKIIDPNNILSLIKDVRPEFQMKRKKRIDNSSHDKNPQNSYNLSEYQKQRNNLVKQWKEIEKEQTDKSAAQNIKYEKGSNLKKISADFEKHNKPKDELFIKKQRPKCIECGKLFSRKDYLKSHMKRVHKTSYDFEKDIEPKDKLFTKKQRPKCVECGKLFSRNDKLSSHIKLVHTYEPCTCPFCGNKTLKNKSYLAKHIKKDHKDFKMPKEESKSFTKKRMPKCIECGKLFSSTDKLNIHIKLAHTYEPCMCPFCGNKTLKNKSHLAKHIKKNHKDFKMPKEETKFTFNEEEKIKINEVLIAESYTNLSETKQNKIIDVKQEIFETAEIFDPSSCPVCEGTILKNKTYLIKHLEQFHKDYNYPEENASIIHEEEEVKINPDILNFEPEASNGLGMWNNETYKVKHDTDKEFVKKETKDDTDENINSKQYNGDIKPFRCNECPKTFEKDCLLKRHIAVHFDVKPFCCNDCPKTFASKGAVNYHKLSHTNEKPFMCDICSHTFTTKNTFENHKLIHTGEKPFQCADCGQTFRLKDFMNTHRKKFHTSENHEKQHMCDICSQTFITKTKLVQHKLIHTGEKPFQCDECGASFRLKFVMRKHKKKIHGADKSLICKICSKTFKFPGMVEAHERGHVNDDTPSTCNLCSETFINASKLKWHKKNHREQSSLRVDHLCLQCGKLFLSKTALGRHITTAHPKGKQPRICSLCNKDFQNAADLKEHQSKAHIEGSQTSSTSVFECQECNKEFSKSHDLYVHNYSTHTIQNIDCPNCGKTCKNKVALNKHLRRTCSSFKGQSSSEQTSQVNSEQTYQVNSEHTTQVNSEQPSQVNSEQTSQVNSEQTYQVNSEQTSQVNSEQTYQGNSFFF